MIYGISVLIVIISPNMKESNWIEWEISYALKEIKRGDKTSRINGVIGVIQKVNESYNWIINSGTNADGCNYISFDKNKLLPIINKNIFNSNPPIYYCENCNIWSGDEGSYISLVEEELFLKDPIKYIDIAYSKIEKKDKYKIVKEI